MWWYVGSGSGGTWWQECTNGINVLCNYIRITAMSTLEIINVGNVDTSCVRMAVLSIPLSYVGMASLYTREHKCRNVGIRY